MKVSTDKEWEKPYIEAIVEAIHPASEVLEVGFGLSSIEIRKYHPKNHTIIEPDPVSAKEANVWAKKYPDVVVLEETWQSVLPTLGLFDSILYKSSEFNPDGEEDPSSSIVKGGEALVNATNELFPGLAKMRYSETDVDAFCKSLEGQKKELDRFLFDIEHSGQITGETRQKMVKKYHLEGMKVILTPKKEGGALLSFLTHVLKSHMRKGARFSAFLEEPLSKYEDPLFFKEIITNPDLNYKEFSISVKASKSYPFNEALVILVEKLV